MSPFTEIYYKNHYSLVFWDSISQKYYCDMSTEKIESISLEELKNSIVKLIDSNEEKGLCLINTYGKKRKVC